MRRPLLEVGFTLHPLLREPQYDGDRAALPTGVAACRCGRDLSEATWSAYVNLYYCECRFTYALRFRSPAPPAEAAAAG